MTQSRHWTRDFLPEPHTRKQASSRSSRPWWVQLALGGIAIYGIGWALRSMPSPPLSSLGQQISPYTLQIAIGFWVASAVLLALWIPARLRTRGRRGEPDGTTPEQLAVAEELKVPVEHVRVRVQVQPALRPPFWKLRAVRVSYPRGKVTSDPSKRITSTLQPLLGATHKDRWRPRRGQLVLKPGEAERGEVDLPEAKSDPEQRAAQVVEGVLKTDQLRTEPLEHDEDGNTTAFKVRHPVDHRMAGNRAEEVLQQSADMLPEAPGGRGWKVEIDKQRDAVVYRARPRIPTRYPHPVLDHTTEFGQGVRLLPFGVSETGDYIGWDISQQTQCPHCLLSGATGMGKTSTIRTFVVEATRQSGHGANQIEVWGLDPKMIELMGLDQWPGVTRIAFTVDDIADLLDAAHAEMMDRYHRIHRREIHPSQLPALVLIVDEYMVLRMQLMRWWKQEQAEKGSPPQLGKLEEMLALARSAGVYLCLGIQRPDATNFPDGARDNMRTRIAHDLLSQQGRQMLWGDADLGIIREPSIRGRSMASGPDGVPLETQRFWTPDLDQHPMWREAMSAEDRALIDALRPADYTPYTLTKSGLYAPDTDPHATPSESSVQAEMMDEQADVLLARQLTAGDRIKVERGEDRWESAVVEHNPYEDGDDTVELEICWDHGGGGETLTLPDNDEVYLVKRDPQPG